MICKKGKKLQVLHTPAGFYIGTTEDGMPYCRCTDYYPTEESCEKDLLDGSWLQRIAMEVEFCSGGDCKSRSVAGY